MSLLAVGTVAFDAIETPFGKTDKIVGGAATYVTLAASYFTNDINLVAVVGSDFPQEEIDILNNHGVNTDGLQIKQGEKSFFWSGKYHSDMNSRDTLITELNVLADFDPIIPQSYQDCQYLMLGNFTPAQQHSVLKRLNNRPKLVVLDTMNFWMDVALDDLKAVLKEVDVITINDAEARQLSGEYSLLKAARKITSMGPRFVIIKKGEHGALLFGDNQVFNAPALLLEEVYDPTGAGDSFAGGFIGYLSGIDKVDFNAMKQAVICGSAMASFCVEKFGTSRLLNLSKQEINSRIAEFSKITSFEAVSI